MSSRGAGRQFTPNYRGSDLQKTTPWQTFRLFRFACNDIWTFYELLLNWWGDFHFNGRVFTLGILFFPALAGLIPGERALYLLQAL